MFSRNVSFKLKPRSTAEFTRILEGEIIPLLRRQRGFEDEISFIAPERNEAVAISLWDKKEDAEAYHRGSYPEVLKTMAKVVDATPELQNFELDNSPSPKTAVPAPACRKQTVAFWFGCDQSPPPSAPDKGRGL